MSRIGIIGGTGLGETLLREAKGERIDMTTPFGRPSMAPMITHWQGAEIVFLSRHGEGHRLNPTNVPYRANIWALKKLGVSVILASGAVGSLREDIEPGHLVLCDQVIDRTYHRPGTFFEEGLVVHVELSDPFCPGLRKVMSSAGGHVDTTIHQTGTYICVEGPQFSTRAESHLHRQWGADVVGMTCMPEAKLAREAEICYALVALVTDYDCWRPAEPDAPRDSLLREIFGNLERAGGFAEQLMREAMPRSKEIALTCPCRRALQLAVWSDVKSIDSTNLQRLEPLLQRYLTDKKRNANS